MELLARSRQGERGAVVIEFALMILVLMLLALGVIDFGMAVQQGMVVSAAAHAGAVFGVGEGNANNTSGMQSAAQSAAQGLVAITATASTWCTCSAGGTAVSCSSLCNLVDTPIQYVQVQTSATVPMMFRFTGLPASIPLTGNATLRAR